MVWLLLLVCFSTGAAAETVTEAAALRSLSEFFTSVESKSQAETVADFVTPLVSIPSESLVTSTSLLTSEEDDGATPEITTPLMLSRDLTGMEIFTICDVQVQKARGVLRPAEGSPCVFNILRQPNTCKINLQLNKKTALSCDQERVSIDGQSICDQLLLNGSFSQGFTSASLRLEMFVMAAQTDKEPRSILSAGIDSTVETPLEIMFQQMPCEGGFSNTDVLAAQVFDDPDPDIPPSDICFQEFSDLTFSFRSPGYPARYPPNAVCQYEVRRASSDICRLQLTLNQFNVEGLAEGGVCPFDVLQVGDLQLCGERPPGQVIFVEFPGPLLTINFQSDDQTQRPGFDITARQLSCTDPPGPQPPTPRTCDQLFDAPEFLLDSPGFPTSYPEGVSCQYEFIRAGVEFCSLEVTVEEFAVEAAPDCAFDYLELAGERLCGIISSGTTRRIPFGESDFLLGRFTSDSRGTGAGFRIRGRQVPCESPGPGPEPVPLTCDLVINEPVFVLTSPNFPLDYPPDTDCNYQIRRALPDVCSLQVTVQSFDLEDSAGCEGDYLQLDHERLCGQQSAGLVQNITFTGEQVNLLFHSDVVTQRSGFEVVLQQVRCSGPQPPQPPTPFPPTPRDCGGALFGTQVDISSPNFPGPYPPDLACIYSLQKVDDRICELEVRFDTLLLDSFGPAGLCVGDFLEIEGERVCAAQPGEIRRYPFRNFASEILFHTDGITTTSGSSGFLLQLRQVSDCFGPNPPIPPIPPTITPGGNCLVQEHGASVRFASPNIAASEPQSHCFFNIDRVVPSACTLEMRVISFNLAQSEPDCPTQYIQVGDQLVEGRFERVCGFHPEGYSRRFEFERDQVSIEFVSELIGGLSGEFEVVFEQLPCADPFPRPHMYPSGGDGCHHCHHGGHADQYPSNHHGQHDNDHHNHDHDPFPPHTCDGHIGDHGCEGFNHNQNQNDLSHGENVNDISVHHVDHGSDVSVHLYDHSEEHHFHHEDNGGHFEVHEDHHEHDANDYKNNNNNHGSGGYSHNVGHHQAPPHIYRRPHSGSSHHRPRQPTKFNPLAIFGPWKLFSRKPKRFIRGPGPVHGPAPVQVYGPPKPQYGPPKPHYGPPQPHQGRRPHVSGYPAARPNSHYGHTG